MKSAAVFGFSVILLGGSLFLFKGKLDSLRKARAELASVPRGAPSRATFSKLPEPVPDAAKDRKESAEAFDRILASAPRGPNGVPLPQIEALFHYFPSLQQAFLESLRAKRQLDFGQFFASVQMSEDEIRIFGDIMNLREETWAVEAAEASAAGRRIDDAKITAATEFRESQLATLLGKQRFEALVEYRKTIQSRHGIISLSALVNTIPSDASPLSLKSLDRLADLCAENGIFSVDKLIANGANPDFDQVRSNAAKLLTPEQLEIFDLLLDHQQISYARAQVRSKR